MTIHVAVVDDQELVRAGFVALLRSDPDLEVVGEAGQGEEAVRLARATRPNVVLMDIRMPVLDGVEATRQLRDDPRTRDIKVVVLTTFDLDDYVYAALQAGAVGFLLKDTPPVELLRAVHVAAAGDALLAPAVTRRLIGGFVAARPHRPPVTLPTLTDRETEVLTLVARGHSNAEIAELLHLGTATVKTHVSGLLRKLDARSRTHLVIAAYECGLVVPGTSD